MLANNNLNILSLQQIDGKGLGVFATCDIPINTAISVFGGPLLTNEEMNNSNYQKDHSIQIDSDLWLGPSGELDDYFNHSCDANCALYSIKIDNNDDIKTKNKIVLVTLTDIKKNEELTFDYSCYMIDEPAMKPCKCKSKKCRGIIDIFPSLSKELQKEYIKLGIVPNFILNKK